MTRAKETVGRTLCLQGNVPMDLMGTGTPDDMKDYCKKLIETAGKDGGFRALQRRGFAESDCKRNVIPGHS